MSIARVVNLINFCSLLILNELLDVGYAEKEKRTLFLGLGLHLPQLNVYIENP